MKHRLLSTLLLSTALSFLMSCWVTLINLGPAPDFVARWMQAFLLAWPAAAVIAFMIGPPVQRLTARLLAGRCPGDATPSR